MDVANTAGCDDGDACTETDTCSDGLCAGTLVSGVCGDICTGGSWTHGSSGEIVRAGLGLREPPMAVTYGNIVAATGGVVLPQCAYWTGVVRIPVLMVDWEDFDPATDPSNENNPDSVLSGYVPSTPTELSLYLNGPSGPAQYFRDVSGGQADLIFDVYGWIRSSAPDSYLMPRATYLYNLADLSPSYSDPTWSCRKNDVFEDALRDAILAHGLDLTAYDADFNGVLDGAVLVYEGAGGLCSGGNLSWLDGTVLLTDPPGFYFPNATELVTPDSPDRAAFESQSIYMNLYNNMPERYSADGSRFYVPATWTHELGHLLLGYSDYYYERFNLGPWGMSGNHGETPSHPAAFEKWLFARWIAPVLVDDSGIYEVAANEIPDGTGHDAGPYLYVVYLDASHNHFLTIENRRFDSEGNALTQWAPADNRESGLLIVEFDMTQDYFSISPPQSLRHQPARTDPYSIEQWRTYRPGDLFSQCFEQKCITIEPVSLDGPPASFAVSLSAP
ncbi:MAG: hypothetical protein ACE5EO_09640 [Candidatus Krumholzibacteriia bacterium]